ncbi:MAG TPA: FkbM family methyltransferase [Pirellulales bacterium]|nr:FkbM family methyltransferase [Pirellulales bacterium]
MQLVPFQKGISRAARSTAKKLLPGPAAWWTQRGLKRQYLETPRHATMQYDAISVLQCCIAYNEYGGYCVPLASRYRPCAQQILAGCVWERETLEFMMARGGDVIHAGTYFGDFLPALSNSRAAGAGVWAFEPNPENYQCARITTQINRLTNVNLFHAGLGAARGASMMRTTDERGQPLGGLSQIISNRTIGCARTESVEMTRIDDVFPAHRNVEIIQLDVEGMEQEALEGAMRTIGRCLPVLILETVPGDDWVRANLLPLGYRVERTVLDNTVFATRRIPTANQGL